VKGIRTDLDAGADLAELGGAFEYDGGNALARQSERAGQPADATASDDYGQGLHRGDLLLPGVAEPEWSR